MAYVLAGQPVWIAAVINGGVGAPSYRVRARIMELN